MSRFKTHRSHRHFQQSQLRIAKFSQFSQVDCCWHANARLYMVISSKNRCHKPSWQGLRPPPPNGQCPNEQRYFYSGASLGCPKKTFFLNFSLNYWKNIPWKYPFVSFLCQKNPVQKSKICNKNFWIGNDPPPVWNFSKNSSILVRLGFPYVGFPKGR